jgi:hypothetical protein
LQGHGLLLDFHIRKEARDKLLGQVGYQAYSQALAVLRSMCVILPPARSLQFAILLLINEMSGTIIPWLALEFANTLRTCLTDFLAILS